MKQLLAILISVIIIGSVTFGAVILFSNIYRQDEMSSYGDRTVPALTEWETKPEAAAEEEMTETGTTALVSDKYQDMLQVPNLDEYGEDTLKVILTEAIGSEDNAIKLLSIADQCKEVILSQKQLLISAGVIEQSSDYYKYLYDGRLGKLYLVSLADEVFEQMIIFECGIDGAYISYTSIYQGMAAKAVHNASGFSQPAPEDYRAPYPTAAKPETKAQEESSLETTAWPEPTTSLFGTEGYHLNETKEIMTTMAMTEAVTEAATTTAAAAEIPEAGPHNFTAKEPSRAYDTLVFINAVTTTSTFYNTWATAFEEAEIKQAQGLASKYMQRVYDAVVARNDGYRPEAVFSASLDEATNTLVIRAHANNKEGIVCILNPSGTVTDKSEEWVRQHDEK